MTVSPESGRSGIAPGDVKLSVEPDSERSLTIELPTPDFQVTAGEAFDITLRMQDQFGNPVENATETVLLKNTCNTWVKVVNMQGDDGRGDP